jgi:hypothetical protein
MAINDEVPSLQRDLDQLRERAEAHFKRSFDAAAEIAKTTWKNDQAGKKLVDSNWSKYVPTDILADGDALGKTVPVVSARLVRLIKHSPLLSDADVADARRATKEMMAALRFRRHREWNTEVLHDEGSVLGTTPAGQSDDEDLSITRSKNEFESAFAEVGRLMSFLAVEDEDLPAAMAAARAPAVVRFRPGTAFIMMWLDPSKAELEDVKEAIKEECRRFNIVARRSDEIEHSGIITERILNEIAASEFLIADLTGERPSVYYEVGYAHALGKRPILFRKKGTPLHFDLAVHNCPEYENITDLKARLRKRLEALTNRQGQD